MIFPVQVNKVDVCSSTLHCLWKLFLDKHDTNLVFEVNVYNSMYYNFLQNQCIYRNQEINLISFLKWLYTEYLYPFRFLKWYFGNFNQYQYLWVININVSREIYEQGFNKCLIKLFYKRKPYRWDKVMALHWQTVEGGPGAG